MDSGNQTSFGSTSIRYALKSDVINRRISAVSAFESSVTQRPGRLYRLDLEWGMDQLQHDPRRI
jgi:hypothetical protein